LNKTIVSNPTSLDRASVTAFSASPATETHPINVWLVDDSRWLRCALKELLATFEGVRCTADFHSPNAVLSALASQSGPDVILLDIQMGEACGLDAIRSIKALSRHTQVLMFTTCFNTELKRRAFANGASGFLLKHLPVEKILDAIRHSIRHPVPHLKPAPRQNWVARPLPPSGVATRPPRPLRWLKLCLDKIQVRRK
jgi:DNA-binding NarL/FixJ family response regulator